MSDNPIRFRSRNYCAVLYPEDSTHTACVEKLTNGGYNFAAILHDKDVYEDGEKKGEFKKPHWHIVIKFSNAVWNVPTATELGIEPNYLQKCSSVDSALLYLVHEGNPDKYQYEQEAVFGPLKNRLSVLLAEDDEGARAVKIADIIDTCPGPIGYSELLRKAVAAGLYADLRRMGAFAVGMLREHNFEYQYSDGRNVGVKKDFENFDDFQRGPWKEKDY